METKTRPYKMTLLSPSLEKAQGLKVSRSSNVKGTQEETYSYNRRPFAPALCHPFNPTLIASISGSYERAPFMGTFPGLLSHSPRSPLNSLT